MKELLVAVRLFSLVNDNKSASAMLALLLCSLSKYKLAPNVNLHHHL